MVLPNFHETDNPYLIQRALEKKNEKRLLI